MRRRYTLSFGVLLLPRTPSSLRIRCVRSHWESRFPVIHAYARPPNISVHLCTCSVPKTSSSVPPACQNAHLRRVQILLLTRDIAWSPRRNAGGYWRFWFLSSPALQAPALPSYHLPAVVFARWRLLLALDWPASCGGYEEVEDIRTLSTYHRIRSCVIVQVEADKQSRSEPSTRTDLSADSYVRGSHCKDIWHRVRLRVSLEAG